LFGHFEKYYDGLEQTVEVLLLTTCKLFGIDDYELGDEMETAIHISIIYAWLISKVPMRCGKEEHLPYPQP